MSKKHPFVTLGLSGLAITLVLNLGIGLATGETSWVAWWPFYIVWVVFLTIGLGLSRKGAGS